MKCFVKAAAVVLLHHPALYGDLLDEADVLDGPIKEQGIAPAVQPKAPAKSSPSSSQPMESKNRSQFVQPQRRRGRRLQKKLELRRKNNPKCQ